MEDRKLFYKDAYLRTFQTKLVRQEQDESSQWFVILAQTAFYPTGGGQPHDTGAINNCEVIKVEEIDGEIRHYLSRPLSMATYTVTCAIDWERRFDHMQQHAGQHILSAAFEELFGFETISFHLGEEELTIDINTEQLTIEQALQTEERANQIVLENRPIQTRWFTAEQANKYPLRKKLTVTENVRLVIIPDFDYNGCGGTHPHSTSQVSSIKILGWERQKQKIRVQFVCGNRVRTLFEKKQRVLKALSPLLNAPEEDMVNAVKTILQAQKEKEKKIEEANDMLLRYEAQSLLEKAMIVNGKKIASELNNNRPIQELQKLGRRIVTEAADTIAILISESDNRIQLVCARGETATGNMRTLISQLLSLINGKGGGNEMFAQGGGEKKLTGNQLLAKAVEIIKP